MFYNLLLPFASEWTALNVFRYISFRSMAALITALLISILVGPRFIALMHRIKCGQYILSDVSKHAEKAGTPTMGGLLIYGSLAFSMLLWADLANMYVWQTMFVFTGFALIGFWDDLTKLRHHENRGISARTKFLAQIAVSLVAVLMLWLDPGYSSELQIPFFKEWTINLGWFYMLLGVFIMVASSNAVNLTDGLDGLAIGPSIIAALIFSIFIYITGNAKFSEYLLVPFIPGVGEVTVFCAALMGAGLGFLWFNAYPAQIFMGDTGSLALGGVLGFLALLCKQELVLGVAGAIFVAETLSVILQVSYFRFSGGKRIFRMAPLHHHFELKGVPESKIIIRFWILSILLGMISLSVLKLR